MDTVRPVYKKLLIAAIALYVAGTALLLSDLFYKVGELEDAMVHLGGRCPSKH